MGTPEVVLTPVELLALAQEGVLAFVEEKLGNEESSFTFAEAEKLADEVGIHVSTIVKLVKEWELTMTERPVVKRVRGFNTSSNDRFYGPGSSKMHGGSGWEQISGFAGQKG